VPGPPASRASYAAVSGAHPESAQPDERSALVFALVEARACSALRRPRCTVQSTHSRGFLIPTTSGFFGFSLMASSPISLTSPSTNKNPAQNPENPPNTPSQSVSVRNKSILCFLQLPAILIEPMFRLEIFTSEYKSKPKPPIQLPQKVLADMPTPPAIHMAAPQRRV
jgi:hypothetical protein